MRSKISAFVVAAAFLTFNARAQTYFCSDDDDDDDASPSPKSSETIACGNGAALNAAIHAEYVQTFVTDSADFIGQIVANVTTLAVEGNSLRSLNLTRLTLKHLRAGDNVIVSLTSVLVSTPLESADFTANRIRSLAPFPAYSLNLRRNLLTELSGPPSDIAVLNVGENRISKLDGLKSSTLTRLDLSWNLLTFLEDGTFRRLTNLRWLSLRGNFLRAAGFALALESDFRGNFQLADFHLGNLRSFRGSGRFDFSGNSLTSVDIDDAYRNEIPHESPIPSFDAPLPHKSVSDISSSPTSLSRNSSSSTWSNQSGPYLPVASHRLNTSLSTTLHPSNATISTTFNSSETPSYLGKSPNSSFPTSNPILYSTFFQLANVLDVRLRLNLTTIPKSLTNAVVLDLTGNAIEAIRWGDLDDFHALRVLNLSHNSIRETEPDVFGRLEFLRELNLRGNRLESVPIVDSKTLILLNLAGNRLRRLRKSDFSGLPNLKALDVSGNSIEFLGANSFPSGLQTLDISGNPVGAWEGAFDGLRTLKHLRMANVTFRNDSNFFPATDLVALKSLNLSSSPVLASIFLTDEALQRSMKALEILDLTNCDLRRLPPYFPAIVDGLKICRLGENPLDCSRDLAYLTAWIRRPRKSNGGEIVVTPRRNATSNMTEAKCSSGILVRNLPLPPTFHDYVYRPRNYDTFVRPNAAAKRKWFQDRVPREETVKDKLKGGRKSFAAAKSDIPYPPTVNDSDNVILLAESNVSEEERNEHPGLRMFFVFAAGSVLTYVATWIPQWLRTYGYRRQRYATAQFDNRVGRDDIEIDTISRSVETSLF